LGAGCNITIDNNEIDNNSDGQYGLRAPGIRVDDVSKVTITRNTIHDHMQAGIAIANNSDVTIGAESSVTGDIADIQSQYGNDIYSNYAGISFGFKKTKPSNGTFVIRGNQIYSNKAGLGGGIAVTREVAGTILIKQNEIYDNYRGGISIQDDCTAEIIQNDIHDQYLRAGIHTGRNGQNWFGVDGGGGAVLTIRQNKVHDNSNTARGGGIDVRHAAGTIENNLVYNNGKAGIRFGDWITEIINNTVVNNGNDTNDQGGGIIYDELDELHTDPPSGVPPAPLLILNNISAHNQKAGIRACFDNTPGFEERDYNLVYQNNGRTDNCGWYTFGGISYVDDLRCANMQFGGCGAHVPRPLEMDGPHDIIANPMFVDLTPGSEDFHLQATSPAENAGDDESDMGAYGGAFPIDDLEIP
jgi:parallel beta-helix repeat protein